MCYLGTENLLFCPKALMQLLRDGITDVFDRPRMETNIRMYTMPDARSLGNMKETSL